MPLGKRVDKKDRKKGKPTHARMAERRDGAELVIITGMSGSGKASALKAFEDLGYYCVDNLPVELMPRFAELALQSGIPRTALVVDVREGAKLEKLPGILKSVKAAIPTRVIFLEASDASLLRRFSETRRPHPLGTDAPVRASLAAERKHLRQIRTLADLVIDTSKFNVHELRAHLTDRFHHQAGGRQSILVSCVSFGYKQGVPEDADLVFDVRFLPNPHFVAEFRPLTGRHPRVAKYIRSFPQTQEFISRISELLIYLLPHYIHEGKSYLTISFGCTGGQHRSVMIAEDVGKELRKAGYKVKIVHRDSPK